MKWLVKGMLLYHGGTTLSTIRYNSDGAIILAANMRTISCLYLVLSSCTFIYAYTYMNIYISMIQAYVCYIYVYVYISMNLYIHM